MDKKSARKLGLSQRRQLEKDIRHYKNQQIQQKAISYLKEGTVISCYVSLDDEVDTREIIDYCFKNHITICVPKVYDSTLKFYKIDSYQDLSKSIFHLYEPTTNQEVLVSDIDIMFVPLVAYDQEYHRVGYGKGYYDSILKDTKKKIGLAFLDQKMDHIEVDFWDINLDDVIAF